MAEQGSSTKQLVPTLGFGDLMSSAVGQIIGAGIMSLMPAAIATTGRSVFLSFLVAAIITCCQAIPYIFISSVVRARGGQYTTLAMVGGKKAAGIYVLSYIMSNVSLAMYGLSLAGYVGDLFGWPESYEKPVALVVLTAFYALNLIGVDVFAKVQNVLVIVLIGSLIVFTISGIGKVHWDTYFVNDEAWMPNGILGMLQAGGLLTFATGGATMVVNFSAEAKNPTRDIPMVIIVSTLCVAVLYAIMSFVAAGILPYEQVAGKNLSITANAILPKALYYVFIIGGAGCALASTLNNQLATSTKPMLQMCDDGWLPAGFAKLNKRKAPVVLITILYVIAVICVLTGLPISTLSNMCILSTAVTTIILNWKTKDLPKIVPEAWEKSKFHVSQGVLTALCCVSTAASLFNTYLNASSLDSTMIIINVVIIGCAVGYGLVMEKKAHMDISYETVD